LGWVGTANSPLRNFGNRISRKVGRWHDCGRLDWIVLNIGTILLSKALRGTLK